jgi:hypothetical protein
MRHIVQKGETLRKIARTHYGDAKLYQKLAFYNGILDPEKIFIGMVLDIPRAKELLSSPRRAADVASEIAPPHGLDEIIAAFGDIFRYIRDDGSINPRWEVEYLTKACLPFRIPLSWDRSKSIDRILCHARIASLFSRVFEEIEKADMKEHIYTFGGCYNFRMKRGLEKLSTHCWGIAIDLNPDSNRMGSAGDMYPGIIEIFREFGFKWGGDWPGKSKDPMHFQFCSGY